MASWLVWRQVFAGRSIHPVLERIREVAILTGKHRHGQARTGKDRQTL